MSKTLSHLIELNRNKILKFGQRKLSHDQAATVLAETIDQYPDVGPSRFVELYSVAVNKRAHELDEVPLLSSAIDQLQGRGFSDSDVVRCLAQALDRCHPETRDAIARLLENTVNGYASASAA